MHFGAKIVLYLFVIGYCYFPQLPPPQLENALHRIAALKAPLVAHASQLNIRSSLPRSVKTCFLLKHKTFTFVRLEKLLPTSENCSLPVSDFWCWILYVSYIFRSVLAVLGIASDSQTSSQAQTSQGQTGDINNSEKETVTDKSKEESSSASWHASEMIRMTVTLCFKSDSCWQPSPRWL